MAKRASALSEFKEATAIPPKGRTSWAYQVLEEFMQDPRQLLYAEFEDDRKATAKQAALAKVLKAEDSPFTGKIAVERRANRVYIQKA